MEWLSNASNIIIIIGAVVVAIMNIYKFFANSGKGIKRKVKEVKTEQKNAEETRIREVVDQYHTDTDEQFRNKVLAIMQEALPPALTKHYKDIRDQFKGDRQKYLNDITDEVTNNIQDSLEAVQTHETRMVVFTEVLRELLRERIMAIYRRNKHRRELEEHERIELDRSYQAYKSIKGNSYIDDYYNRMKKWKDVPDDYN
jgi:flagellar motor component MotA